MKDKKNYRSPFSRKEKKVAYKYWKLFLDDIVNRKKFHEGMLKNLEILCRLYQEYEDLQAIIDKDGFTFSSDGRYGKQVRSHPCISQRNKVLAEIRAYSKSLGCLPSSGMAGSENDDDEWD